MYIDMLRTLAPELASAEPGKLQSEKLPHLRTVIRMGDEQSPGMFNYWEVARMGGPASLRMVDDIGASLAPNDPINIQFTSGTTGAPKGATLTHRNIVNNAGYVTNAIKLTETDRLCIPVPLYHCFGMVMGTLGCVTKGAAMVFPGEGFDPAETLAAVSNEKCTGVLRRTNNVCRHACPSGLCRRRPVEPAYRDHGGRPLSDRNDEAGHRPNEHVRGDNRLRDDGNQPRVIPTARRTIRSRNACRPLAASSPTANARSSTRKAILCRLASGANSARAAIRSCVAIGGDLERTKEAVDAEGWMHTGDLAVIDEEGYCDIVGRVKDMLIRGGENVYPREVEEYLHRHDSIQEVQIFGVPDEKYGEEICAWIVLKAGVSESEASIREFCEGQISHYKVPRHIRFVDELPMTVTGKPQKFVMRERMMADLGIG